ncbi:hypothetical protein DVQ07_20180 [Yersinia enterocolitica]|nr:hypothetical protein [Yersinia enterocolitica]EKN6149342.1 hypothetical protein [Yersinia enterocolitica]EKN6178442.1 hypothetical protein [Yersinia enterocolitica]
MKADEAVSAWSVSDCGEWLQIIPVILQAACALAAFAHPSHLLVVDLKVSRLPGIFSVAAFLQLELFWV